MLHRQSQHIKILLSITPSQPLYKPFSTHAPLHHPTPAAASQGICCLIASISMSSAPRAATELNTVHCCMKDNGMYKIVLGQGMILFLNINSFLFNHNVQHTTLNRKNNTLLSLSPLLNKHSSLNSFTDFRVFSQFKPSLITLQTKADRGQVKIR
jgi:hypothetical protein